MPKASKQHLSKEQARAIAESCYGEVFAYCKRHAPYGHEAADLTQETFLRFVRAGSYAERGKPIAYLLRIARNVCIDASRKKKLETVTLDYNMPYPDENGFAENLNDALDLLPCNLQEIIELRFGMGLGINEIAQVLSVSRFSVRRQIKSALQFLEKELEEGDVNEYGRRCETKDCPL